MEISKLMLTIKLKQEIRDYCSQFIGEEVGGVIVDNNNEVYFLSCGNLSYDKENHYILSYLDYLKAEEYGKIIGIVHSQKNEGPSLLDSVSAFNFNLYSIIYCWDSDKFFIVNPKLKDYLNRDFKIGKNDCFTLVKDYYNHELNIKINNYDRNQNWHVNIPNLISKNFINEGFVEISKENKKLHDVLLFGKDLENLYHMGVYLKDNVFVHHPRDAKSVIEDLGHWNSKLILVVRHKNLL